MNTMPNDLDFPTQSITPKKDSIGLTVIPRDRGILIQMSGAAAGSVHCLRGEVLTIGRGGQCSLSLEDTTLSRTHARIRRTDGMHILEDEGSLNGSYVNHHRVTRAVLRHGDRLRFGSGVRLQFQLVNPEEEAILVHMYEAAVKDGLTGLVNRRALDDRLKAEFAHAIRHRRELNVLIIDLDFFKKVNDTKGHLAGDEVLRQIAGLFGDQIRCEDLVARYGGEEFVVLARDIPMHGAMLLAERLRAAVENLEMRFDNTLLKVTVSIGVASLSHLPGKPSIETLLTAADKALYAAKSQGRNRVVTAPNSQ